MRSMKQNKMFLLIGVLIGSFALTGCWEDFDVVLHEPGVYKGPADQLVEQGSQAALADRFTQGQTDR